MTKTKFTVQNQEVDGLTFLASVILIVVTVGMIYGILLMIIIGNLHSIFPQQISPVGWSMKLFWTGLIIRLFVGSFGSGRKEK